ncbi:MAG: hypothetical protein R3C11_15120 [Planctomycetaceae bacterium]
MRVQLWLSSIAGLLMLTAATNVHAQYGGFPAPLTTGYGSDSGNYYQASAAQDGTTYYENSIPAGYGMQPNPYAMPGGGVETGVLPDRSIFERILGAPFDLPIQINANFTRTRTSSPDAVVIGDERVSTKVRLAPLTVAFVEDPPGPATVDTVYLDGSDPWGPVAVDEIYQDGPAGGLNFTIDIGGSPAVAGMRITGFWNSNYESGQQWGDRSNLEVDWGADTIRRVTSTGISYLSDDEIDFRLGAFNPGLPYYTGVPLELDSDNSLGDSIGFDVFAEMKFQTQTYGAGVVQAFNPVWKKNNISIQPLVGVQYIAIKEGFRLFGRQSGLDYTVTLPAGTFASNGSGTPLVPWQTSWAHISDPLDTIVDSKVDSNLVGPEAGFAVNMGGENFRIVYESKVGLMVNREKIKLRGSGVASYITWDGPVLEFDQTETYSHLSPMTSHSITAQSNVLRYVPVLRDIDLFDEAVLNVGYNFTHLWEVARPGSTIQWNGAPLTPEIQANREKFYISGWEFGVHWDY